MPYLSASAVVIHYEEALYQVYGPFYLSTSSSANQRLTFWSLVCVRLWDLRSCCMVFSHVMRGRPCGLLQSSGRTVDRVSESSTSPSTCFRDESLQSHTCTVPDNKTRTKDKTHKITEHIQSVLSKKDAKHALKIG